MLLIGIPLLMGLVLFASGAARGQTTDDEEDRLKILTDPESVKKKADKEKARPPLELFRTQVAPFDILPFIKPNHWSTVGVEVRANYNDYEGTLRTSMVPLRGMPQELIFQRDARLVKTQITKLGMQLFLPTVPRDINVELTRPGAVRSDDIWSTTIRQLEAHQMLIMFLSKDSTDSYAGWNRFQALYPHGLDRADTPSLEKPRYFRLVLPIESEKPPVSSHPMTWTTISHVVWDGLPADTLSPTQQQAMLDWLHWGGQLTLVGGASPSFGLLKDSFLAPYLPAEDTGEIALLDAKALEPLSKRFQPPYIFSTSREDILEEEGGAFRNEPTIRMMGRYRPATPITPADGRPVPFNTLIPKPGTVALPLSPDSKQLLGVERRIGRGRILMLAFSPVDPAMARWKGLDTLVRRIVLRRPEEGLAGRIPWDGIGLPKMKFGPLPGPDLSWVRYASRDFGADKARYGSYRPFVTAPAKDADGNPVDGSVSLVDDVEVSSSEPVAEWLDTARLPRVAVAALEEASGIKIPNSSFVLRILLAYLITVVPVNWLVCRYIFKRRELAWVIIPLVSIGFAVLVERAAAYDMGYNTASDEIDVIEIHGGYPRAHLTRFGSLYSTGRTAFKISFPKDPTALALPMATGRALRGEDSTTATFESFPAPILRDYLVQPRSLAMYRSEQMIDLDGAISLEVEEGKRFVRNASSLELKDATVVVLKDQSHRVETYLGMISPGARVEIPSNSTAVPKNTVHPEGLDPETMLTVLRNTYEPRPENAGQVRLAAWTATVLPGREIEPAVDRQRGYSAVLVNLESGPPPSPDSVIYDALKRPASQDPDRSPPKSPAGGPKLGIPGEPSGGSMLPIPSVRLNRSGRPRLRRETDSTPIKYAQELPRR